jgi:twinkle protein|tara:strand:- start:883 stop:2577 length:1695 start_codon:yes stop_codon:yes gene_type:complete
MTFIKHNATCPSCNKDHLSLNEDGSGKCFYATCGRFHPAKGDSNVSNIKQPPLERAVKPMISVDTASTYSALSDRRISEETAKKYGVTVVNGVDGKPIEHHYPYFNGNELAATKIRKIRDAKGEKIKGFFSKGSFDNTSLFGEQLFNKGGKYITITEGECDAMATYELMGSKWAAVSIKRGAEAAERDVKESLEFLESFENVIICFDKDKSGVAAAKKIAKLFQPSKAKIMTLPNGFKDANDMLIANKHKDFMESWWSAKTYTPSGVINVSDEKKKFFNRPKKECVPYPWEGLNKKLYGLRQGELVTLTGGTGLGKSSVTRELEHHLIKNTTDNVGIIALEEDWRRTIDGILSIEANARLYIDQEREKFSAEELDGFFDLLYDGENKNRVWVHAHFGTNSIDEIFNKLRFMIIACECKWIIVDHLHMLVSAVSEGDERRAIDNIMTRLRSLVEETGVGLILVSHLRRTSGDKGHENGIEVSLSHLRGSQAIAQLSDCVIALERNQQADDEDESNTTVVRVLKSRYVGDVGAAALLLYDRETGRLNELDKEPFEGDDADFSALEL